MTLLEFIRKYYCDVHIYNDFPNQRIKYEITIIKKYANTQRICVEFHYDDLMYIETIGKSVEEIVTAYFVKELEVIQSQRERKE